MTRLDWETMDPALRDAIEADPAIAECCEPPALPRPVDSFYLAAPWRDRARALADARQLAAQTGMVSTARWLTEDWDSWPNWRVAAADFRDIRESGILVARGGRSTEGGMWAEVGYAIGRKIPVLLYETGACPRDELTPFACHPRILGFPSLYWLAGAIAEANRLAIVEAESPDG